VTFLLMYESYNIDLENLRPSWGILTFFISYYLGMNGHWL
jgi:hypothetical protein